MSGPLGEGFEPGYGLRLVTTRIALIKAVLEEVTRSITTTSLPLHDPDPGWDAITAAAREMLIAQDEWRAYFERKRAEKGLPCG